MISNIIEVATRAINEDMLAEYGAKQRGTGAC